MSKEKLIKQYAKGILITGPVLAALLGSLISTEVAGIAGMLTYISLVLWEIRNT